MLAVLLLNGHDVLLVRFSRLLAVYTVHRNTVFSTSIIIHQKPPGAWATSMTVPDPEEPVSHSGPRSAGQRLQPFALALSSRALCWFSAIGYGEISSTQ